MTRLMCPRGLRRSRICTMRRTCPSFSPFPLPPFSFRPLYAHAHANLSRHRNQCSIFRPWQGWTSLSSTGPGEGTLRVLPLLSLASAYIMLRPFFRPRASHSSSSSLSPPSSSSLSSSSTPPPSLAFEDWEPDTEGAAFPGSALGKAQELSEATHPHLRLGQTVVSIPRVEPGDQVYCECARFWLLDFGLWTLALDFGGDVFGFGSRCSSFGAAPRF